VGHGFLGNVPHQSVNQPRAIPEAGEEVQVRIAVGPELLIGQKENVIDGITVIQLIQKTPGHGTRISYGGEAGMNTGPYGRLTLPPQQGFCRLPSPDYSQPEALARETLGSPSLTLRVTISTLFSKSYHEGFVENEFDQKKPRRFSGRA
jgi:hypothetical protein